MEGTHVVATPDCIVCGLFMNKNHRPSVRHDPTPPPGVSTSGARRVTDKEPVRVKERVEVLADQK